MKLENGKIEYLNTYQESILRKKFSTKFYNAVLIQYSMRQLFENGDLLRSSLAVTMEMTSNIFMVFMLYLKIKKIAVSKLTANKNVSIKLLPYCKIAYLDVHQNF